MSEGAIFVLPSVSEALGRVVFEAMAAGTPVIGSRTGGIPDMVIDGETGFLVPPGDEEALAEKLRWALSHPNEIHEMGRRARNFARRFFSTESYVEGYSKLVAEAGALAGRVEE
jgi:glycosyltransferase involved in cell wall biosynthesis